MVTPVEAGLVKKTCEWMCACTSVHRTRLKPRSAAERDKAVARDEGVRPTTINQGGKGKATMRTVRSLIFIILSFGVWLALVLIFLEL